MTRFERGSAVESAEEDLGSSGISQPRDIRTDRAQDEERCVYLSFADEVANSLTHGLGLALATFGSVILMGAALRTGDAWRIIGCAIYSAALVALYAASTLSHIFYCHPRWRRVFRMLDQALIYLLIVGTFTPFSLVYLRSGGWWIFFAAMWTLALTGFFSKVLFAHRVESVLTIAYIALGWMPILVSPLLVRIVPGEVLWLMLAGGLCYTAGTLFLAFDTKIRFFHAAWHLWVIAGSMLHFLAVYWHVATIPAL